MAPPLTNFKVITFAGQQLTTNFGFPEDNAFPLALETKENWTPSLEEAVEHVSSLSKSGDLFNLIQKHGGAVLLRGLPISTPDDYSRIAHAFGFDAHEEVGRPPIRTVLAPNVKTANEGPPELPIWPHNEYGWSTHNPAWLTFSCLDVPESGGATPIISSLGLAYKLEKEAPDFFKQLLEKGVRYVYRYGREEVKSNTGASVFAAYGQHVKEGDDEETIKNKIEKEVKRHSELFEWHEDGSLSVTHIVPSMHPHVPLPNNHSTDSHSSYSKTPFNRPDDLVRQPYLRIRSRTTPWRHQPTLPRRRWFIPSPTYIWRRLANLNQRPRTCIEYC